MGKKKPAHEVKLGIIRACIWENATPDGDAWCNVTLTRRYRSEGKWDDTSALRRDDLPIAIMALDMAYRWIWARHTGHLERNQQSSAGTDTEVV